MSEAMDYLQKIDGKTYVDGGLVNNLPLKPIQGKWTLNFVGTASDDGPNGVYSVEWDFNYDGSTFKTIKIRRKALGCSARDGG